MTTGTGTSVTITSGLPERGPTRPLASGEIIPVLKETLVELALGRRPLRTCVFVVEIAGVLILEMGFRYAHDAYVDLRRRILQFGEE